VCVWGVVVLGLPLDRNKQNKTKRNKQTKHTTLSNGYLGSRNDEERSELRNVMRIADIP